MYGEKRISVEGPAEGEKIEYRVWNPFRSKLAASVLAGVDNIHVRPGAKARPGWHTLHPQYFRLSYTQGCHASLPLSLLRSGIGPGSRAVDACHVVSCVDLRRRLIMQGSSCVRPQWKHNNACCARCCTWARRRGPACRTCRTSWARRAPCTRWSSRTAAVRVACMHLHRCRGSTCPDKRSVHRALQVCSAAKRAEQPAIMQWLAAA